MFTLENMSFSSNSRSWGTARSKWKRAFSATFDMVNGECRAAVRVMGECGWVVFLVDPRWKMRGRLQKVDSAQGHLELFGGPTDARVPCRYSRGASTWG